MFKLDSPFMNFLNKVCDIMILNMMILICSIPIVTIGASVTAAYYMGYKMVRNEESYIIKGFLKAFKENFKQSTIIWLIMLLVAAILYGDFKIIADSGLEFGQWLTISLITVTVVLLLGVSFIFPLQARFSNTVKNTIKNGFLMALSHLPSAFLMVVVWIIPVAVLYFLPQALPALVLLAFGALPYFKSFLFLKIFKKYEEMMISKADEEKSQAEVKEDVDSGLFAVSEFMEKEIEKTENDKK